MPVNANNDNGSQVTDGWPARRDFEYPYNPGDFDFVRATVTEIPPGSEGELTYGFTSLSEIPDVVRFWDAGKQNVTEGGYYPNVPADVFHIEGLEPSIVEDDVKITVCYVHTVPPDPIPRLGWGVVYISITPIIKEFTVKPYQAGQPNIHFKANDPLRGLIVNTPDGDLGVKFLGHVRKNSIRGDLVFIHNLISVGNALHAGSTAGVEYTPGSGLPSKNLLPKPEKNFPMVDSNPYADGFPIYNHGSFQDVEKTAEVHKIYAEDAPDTGTPSDGANANKISLMDMNYVFTLYLVWQFPGDVFYPLAEIDWYVEFWADDKRPGGQQGNGLNQILNPFGLLTPGVNVYSRTHEKPGALALTDPIAEWDMAYQ